MLGVYARVRILPILSTLCLLYAAALPRQSQSLTPVVQPLRLMQRPSLEEPAAPASKVTRESPPHEMHMCIAHCFVIQWKNGSYLNVGPQNTSTYTVDSFTRESVIMHRRDVGSFPPDRPTDRPYRPGRQ